MTFQNAFRLHLLFLLKQRDNGPRGHKGSARLGWLQGGLLLAASQRSHPFPFNFGPAPNASQSRNSSQNQKPLTPRQELGVAYFHRFTTIASDRYVKRITLLRAAVQRHWQTMPYHAAERQNLSC